MQKNNIMIFIPTYNERENILAIYQAIKKLAINADLVICDDNSPDQTGKIIDEIAQQDSCVIALHRPKKMGLGTAHQLAFEYARNHHYTLLLTMDADFTHNPTYIPAMLSKAHDADIVIGSRYLHGAQMKSWGRFRLPLTYLWKWLIKVCLGLAYDTTGAFRVYKVSILHNLPVFASKEFSFNIEVLYYFKQQAMRIAEVPIIAHNRVHGSSKLSRALIFEEARVFLSLWKKSRNKK